MLNALRDYNHMVIKSSGKWLRKHWKGYSVFLVMRFVLPFVVLKIDDMTTWIKRKFKRQKKES